MDEVRKAEAKERKRPKATRWAVLKAADGGRLIDWRLKEMLRWIRKAFSVQVAQWHSTQFTRHALKCIAP
ncbi:hypothetical protein DFAR_3460039 [Desulfarculales bacterium]